MHQLLFSGQVEAQGCSIVLRHPGYQLGDGGFGRVGVPRHAHVVGIEVFVDLFLGDRPLHQGAGATAGLSADDQQHSRLDSRAATSPSARLACQATGETK